MDAATRRSARSWGAVAAAASLTFTLALGAAPAAVAAPSDYPTWQDVQNAKKSEAAKQAEVATITKLVQSLQKQADAAQRDAQTKAELYSIAQLVLDAATRAATQLAAARNDAKKQASASARRAGVIVAQLARTGGGDVTLGLVTASGHDTDQLLQRLGSMNRLSAVSQEILEKAQFDKNTAAALAKQATVAKNKRTALAADAQQAADAARSAADAADAKVASIQAKQTVMFSQLASLKGTTAAVEQGYQTRLAVEAAEAAAKVPTDSGSGGGTSGGSGGGSAGVDPDPGPPSPGAVGTAIAYAERQLGKPYRLGGAGPTYWDCSGLTMMWYRAAGVYIGPHGSTSQYNYMRSIGRLVPRSSGILAGDLLFYADGGSAGASVKYHVAMAINGSQMIEAPRLGVPVRIVGIRALDLVPYVGRPTG
jgi:cell wall-associated NlpC family hydrolase